jgi:hypothetical protein
MHMNLAEQLETLSRLRDSGALTEHEFALAKVKLLADAAQPLPPADTPPTQNDPPDTKAPDPLQTAAEGWVAVEKQKLILGFITFLLFFILFLIVVSKITGDHSFANRNEFLLTR